MSFTPGHATTPGGGDVIDARCLLTTDEAIPPILYLSPEPGDARLDAFTELMFRDGLPRLAVTAGTWDVGPAAPGWETLVGPGRHLAVHCPAGGPARPVMSALCAGAPDGWHDFALVCRHVALLIGPARPFRHGAGSLRDVLDLIQAPGVLAGVVPARPAGGLPPGLART